MSEDFWEFLGGRSYLEMMLDAKRFKTKTRKSRLWDIKVNSFWFGDKICECIEFIPTKRPEDGHFWQIIVRGRKPNPSVYGQVNVANLNKDSFISNFEYVSGGIPLEF
jgi:hypothetical protein